MTLEEARASIGAVVVYKSCPHCSWGRERGVITSVSRSYVFVEYAGGPPKATEAADLTLARHPAVTS